MCDDSASSRVDTRLHTSLPAGRWLSFDSYVFFLAQRTEANLITFLCGKQSFQHPLKVRFLIIQLQRSIVGFFFHFSLFFFLCLATSSYLFTFIPFNTETLFYAGFLIA